MARWTNEDENYLIEHYKYMTNKELAESLNRSTNSIMQKKSKLGLRKTKKHHPIVKGDTFEDWTVESLSYIDEKGNDYYKCSCSCGVLKDIRGAYLKSGESTSCGGFKHFDLTGKAFGDLTVLKYSHKDKNRKSHYECLCSCGYVKIIRGDSLTGGSTKTCGRKEHNSLIGRSFYKWKVIEVSHIDVHENVYYTCKCSCGNIRDVRGKHLLSGGSTSCGCSTEYKGEVRIRQYFESKTEFVYKEQVEYEGLLSKDGKRNLISDGALYDNYGNLMFMIEYDGIQHYEYRPFFHRSKKDFDEQVRRDRLKDDYCSKNGINMLRIAYRDYDNIESILDNYIKKQGEI